MCENYSKTGLWRAAEGCALCPNACGAVRSREKGLCGADGTMRVARYALHPFEEPCISLGKGSGTVFFCGCPLGCVFCQNYEISHLEAGVAVSPQRLAEIFAELEAMGAENINLVNPTHYAPLIGEAFRIYRPNLPVVYNTHGYETDASLAFADEYTDVYLADLKFFSPSLSRRYTGKDDYFAVASESVKKMIKSRKTQFIGQKMVSGVIVRHLVMPLASADAREIIKWFSQNGGDAWFSLMAQYVPHGEAEKFPELCRRITPREYRRALDALAAYGVENCFVQQLSSASDEYIPSWDMKE